MDKTMRSVFRRRTWWIFCNAVGMMVYLYLASDLWVLPGEEGQPGGPGDAFYWLFFLVPILVVFVLANLVVLTVIAWRRRGRQRLVAASVWGAVAVLWVATVAVDHQRSVRYIDARYGQAGVPADRLAAAEAIR